METTGVDTSQAWDTRHNRLSSTTVILIIMVVTDDGLPERWHEGSIGQPSATGEIDDDRLLGRDSAGAAGAVPAMATGSPGETVGSTGIAPTALGVASRPVEQTVRPPLKRTATDGLAAGLYSQHRTLQAYSYLR